MIHSDLGAFEIGLLFASLHKGGRNVSLNLVIRGVRKELAFELDPSAALRLGRSRRCDLVVKDPTVSRIHAEIRMEEERVLLRDLDSTNGTFVNDVRTETEFVAPGDRIRLGSAELEMCLDSCAANAHIEIGDNESHETPNDDVLFGVAENLSPVDLVQVLAQQGKSGTLMLHYGQFGRIDFQSGRACYAKVGGIEGEKAFHRILGWQGAEFQFRGGHPRQVNLKQSIERLLVDNMRMQSEYQSLLEKLPDPRCELCLDPPPADVELTLVEAEVIRRMGESRTLVEVIDSIPHLDFEVAKAVSRLLEMKILLASPV
jgi:hypothetical protein